MKRMDKYCGSCLYQFRNEDGAHCQTYGLHLISDGADYIRYHKCRKEGAKDTGVDGSKWEFASRGSNGKIDWA